MINTNTKLQCLDKETKARAERIASILSNVPPDKEPFFLAIANAYLDGLITGQELESRAK